MIRSCTAGNGRRRPGRGSSWHRSARAGISRACRCGNWGSKGI